MFDKFVLFLGGASTAAALTLQGMAVPGGAHAFGLQVAGLVCTAVSAGCLAVSPSVRGAARSVSADNDSSKETK